MTPVHRRPERLGSHLLAITSFLQAGGACMSKENLDHPQGSAMDDRFAALQYASGEHGVPTSLLASAVQCAEDASRHRLRAVSASRIDELVTDMVQSRHAARDAT